MDNTLRIRLKAADSSKFIFLLCAGLLLQGCVPVFSDFQSARLVGKGRTEVTPSFNSVWVTDDGETEHVQQNLGAQVAHGIDDWVEVRIGYTRVLIDDIQDFNVLGLGPKLGGVEDHVALYLPVGFAFGQDLVTSESWAIHPTLLFTAQASEQLEINPSAKLLIPLGDNDTETLLVFNLGAGIGDGSGSWSFRPEFGVLINPGESGIAWSLGFGFAFRLGPDE